MKRREFIILSSIGATSASLLSACGHPEEKLIPALIPDDEFVPGIDYWKPSTCGMCAAGCGILVRTREHKANKIEGNPLHPVNRGALCARGQAGLELLYNPDRIKSPMLRSGRGEGKWAPITWDEAIKIIAEKLREVDPNSSAEKAMFITGDPDGITAHVAGLLMQKLRQAFVTKPSAENMKFTGSDAESMGAANTEAIFDIANATYLLSLGARFLETWKSPVMYSQAYGQFRSSRGKARGRFVHVEPRMSLTAANADEWIAAAPGTEELVARAIAQVIVREGLSKVQIAGDASRILEDFSPESLADTIDVPAERIIRIAREFAGAERPLAIGNLKSPIGSAVLLNAIVANLNKPGGVLTVDRHDESKNPFKIPESGFVLPGELKQQIEKVQTGEGVDRISQVFQVAQRPFKLLMIHGLNHPVEINRWRDELARIPYIVSFSPFLDETDFADLVVPDHTYLESWDVHRSYGHDGRKVVSLKQPVLAPQLDTRQTADVLLAVARELGGEVSAALPFESAKDLIEKGAIDIAKSIGFDNSESAWTELTEKGLVSSPAPVASKTAPSGSGSMALNNYVPKVPERNASETSINSEYPLTLIVYEHAAFGDGPTANLPSIQELPDPLTSVIWGSWVEINPKTAREIGVADGDLVEVTTANGSLRAAAILYPAIRPDCIAMPSGQGRSSYGRYARGRGVDPSLLLQSPGENTVRSRLTRVGEKAQLVRFGTELMEHMESKR